MDGQGESPPPPEEGLARDRCPSCGGKLTYEPGRDQGFCAIEGIYVEVLVPPPDAERPPLVREAVLQATKRDLQRLCKAYGQRTSGNKTDLLTRLLRYMDEHGIDVPPEDVAEAAVRAPPPIPEAPAEEASKPAGQAAPTPALEAPPRHGPDVDTLLAEVEHLAAQPAPSSPPPPEVPPGRAEEPVAPEEPPTKPEPEYVVAAAEAAPVEAAPEEEAFLLEAAGMAAPEAPAAEAESAEVPVVAAAAPPVDAARLRRDRIALYVGTVLAAVGGPGLVAGSVLHDAFQVPWFGDTYDAFGPLNMAAALIGGVVLAGGLVAMGVGLRGGIVRAPTAKEG